MGGRVGSKSDSQIIIEGDFLSRIRTLAIVCCWVSTACSGAPDAFDEGKGTRGEPVRLVVTGSSTLAPLVSEVAKRFESLHPQVRVDVQTGGSSRGIADVRRGMAQIGMVSRSPREDETDLVWHPIALDGIALIVHSANPVSNLTTEQVRAIFAGQVENWSDLGGNDAPITVIHKAEGRSTLEVFLEHFDLRSAEVQADVIIGDNQQGIKTVVGNPDAIGYVSIGTAEYEVSAGTRIRSVSLDGSPPSRASLRDGRYPMARTLHVVTPSQENDSVRAFLDFLRSFSVDDLVEGQFFVPLSG